MRQHVWIAGAVAWLFVGCSGGGSVGDDMPAYDVFNPRAVLRQKGPQKLDRLLWEYPVGSEVWGGVGVGSDTVYVGARRGTFVALDRKTGAVRWKNTLDPDYFFKGSPLVFGDVVIAGAQHGRLHGFSTEDGASRWMVHAHAAFNATNRLANGVLYAASMEGIVYAVDPTTGRELWRFTSPAKTGFSTRPAVADGAFYIADMGREVASVMKVSLATREVEWTSLSSSYVMAPLAVDKGRVFVANGVGELFALDAATGERLWGFGASYAMNAAPVFDDKRVFGGSRDGYVYALNRETGDLLWKTNLHLWVESGLVRAANLLYGGAGNILFALDPETGREVARFAARETISFDIALADGVLYFGDMSGHVYAVGDQ